MTKYIVYVDGSYNISEKKYGGAYFIVAYDKDENYLENKSQYGMFSGVETEIAAERQIPGECGSTVIACGYLLDVVEPNDIVEIRYDFQGIEMWVNGAWRAKKRTAKEYVEQMNKILPRLPNVSFSHTRGHLGEIGNEFVDQLAKYSVNVRKTEPIPPHPNRFKTSGYDSNTQERHELKKEIKSLQTSMAQLKTRLKELELN